MENTLLKKRRGNKMKSWADMTKKELLALPKRPWNEDKIYRWVLLVNTRTKHNSGYNFFAVIGVEKDGNMEIAAYCDDFRTWPTDFALSKGCAPAKGFSFDCSMHGVFRIWSNYYNIFVGTSLSTTDFAFIPVEQKD